VYAASDRYVPVLVEACLHARDTAH
jgi:hypothetical protein